MAEQAGPPADVITGVFRGGDFDGLEMEIDGQATITINPCLIVPPAPGEQLPPAATYRFRGEITDDRVAVYELETPAGVRGPLTPPPSLQDGQIALPRIVLMPDYGADPLWNSDGGEMVSLDALPISAALRERVRAWAERWEELADPFADEAFDKDEEAWAPIQQEKEALWLALREELRGRCEVGLVVPPPGRKRRRHVIWSPGETPEPG